MRLRSSPGGPRTRLCAAGRRLRFWAGPVRPRFASHVTPWISWWTRPEYLHSLSAGPAAGSGFCTAMSCPKSTLGAPSARPFIDRVGTPSPFAARVKDEAPGSSW